MHPTFNEFLHTYTNYLLHPPYLVEFKLHPASWDPRFQPPIWRDLVRFGVIWLDSVIFDDVRFYGI